MNAEMEADRQRDQELLDQYGGAIRIWYNENSFGGKEGNIVCPGNDIDKAVQQAIDQIPSKDPNALIITQVDVLEGYYDPESGMTPYDGEPVWRVAGQSPTATAAWDEAEYVLKNLRLDTKEGWIREQANQYGTNLQAKETIKDIGLSEGKFKNDHEFDVLWDFAINYDDDDIDASTNISASSNKERYQITWVDDTGSVSDDYLYTTDEKSAEKAFLEEAKSYSNGVRKIKEIHPVYDYDDPDFYEMNNMDINASSELADWICDHEQACADLLTHYRVNDIDALSDGQILDWISDHKQLSEDYTRRFGKTIESSCVEEVNSRKPMICANYPNNYLKDRSAAREFLTRFNNDFLADLEEAWKDYLHEMSEYYFQRDDGLEVEMPNENEWLAGLAESYPASSEENIRRLGNALK